MRHLLLAFQHADSAFPSGSFAFSNGVEGVAAAGARLDPAGLGLLLDQILRHRWASFDRIALARAHRAAPDLGALAALDAEIEAASLCAPLRDGSRRNAAALLAAHLRIGTPGAEDLRAAMRAGSLRGHLAVVQGFLWRALGLDEPAALAMSAYGAAMGAVTAAVRLGAIGAIAAQPVLAEALRRAADLAEAPVPAAARLAAFLPFVEIAAARNEAADLRLFAS
ncbi:urease accessory protein UreF [Propylenella binzhouense]|uniref:Urease accessory protein UreF n=1 Tax=Propylenella binzhouense TaxID=2555902 RepID=A0A964T7X8_9HYPH|nr:urease accessory UreF family protein [Propylenella binzhouense]MYZ49439.1 urease accessory protein UreF [Propylenella binzhouense]